MARVNTQERLTELQKEAQAVAKNYDIFSTAQGKIVWNDLIQTYGGTPLVPGDPYATHYNIGCQAVLTYINEMIESNGK